MCLLTLPDGAGMGDAIRMGVSSATAPVLAFARSGECCDLASLERHAAAMQAQGTDMLCYAQGQAMPGKETPAPEVLKGELILLHYLRQGCRHNLAGKLFDRGLCRVALDVLHAAPETLALPFFSAALHFHAKRHVVAAKALPEQSMSGGASSLAPDDASTGPGRMMAISALLQTFVPYCRREGAPPSLALACTEILEALLVCEREACLSNAEPSGFLRWGTESDALRALIVSHPLMRAARDEVIARRERKQRKTRPFDWALRVFSFGGRA